MNASVLICSLFFSFVLVVIVVVVDNSTGRNFVEIIRVIDSLQLSSVKSVTTPANWKQGDDVIVHPSIDDDQVRIMLSLTMNNNKQPTNQPTNQQLANQQNIPH